MTGLGAFFRQRRRRRAFQAALDGLREKAGFPGAVAAYAIGGDIADFATGHADLEGRRPMPRAARLLSASVGKMHVGALAWRLQADGVIDLDRPISAWLSDRSWFSRLPNHDAMTLRHLLSHSAGLVDHVGLPEFLREALPKMRNPDFYYRPEELVAFILDREPLFPVGAGFAYTDTGFIVAGLAIEAATGKPYYDLLRERLLAPLRLDDTVPADRRRIPRLAPGFLAADNPLGLPRSTMKDGRLLRHPLTEWTGGGLADTARGLVSWSRALFETGAVAPRYADVVREYAVATDETGARLYGLGVAVRPSPLGPRYCHGGWMPGYRADISYFSDAGLSVSMMVNTDDPALIGNEGVQDAVADLAAVIADNKAS